jgi:HlyD family secretion protein
MILNRFPKPACAAGLAVVLALSACGPAPQQKAETGSAEAAAQKPRATVRVAPITLRAMNKAITASGELTVRDEIAIASDLEGQKIARLLVDEGDWVAAGQPIAVLDGTLLSAQATTLAASLQRAQAALAAEEARAAQAVRERDRVEGLSAEGVVAAELVEQRTVAARVGVHDRAAAAADVALARAQIGETSTRRARLTLRAPAGGLVLARTARVGDVVGSASGPLFRIARGGLIELSAEVAERDLARIGSGTPATVSLPDGKVLSGEVRLVSPLVDRDTRMGRVRIALPVDPGLRPGGFGRATFDLPAAPLAAVPDRAVLQGVNSAAILVVDGGDIVRRVPVKVVQRAGGWSGIESLEPLEGRRVILSGGAFAAAGDRVTPVTEHAS